MMIESDLLGTLIGLQSRGSAPHQCRDVAPALELCGIWASNLFQWFILWYTHTTVIQILEIIIFHAFHGKSHYFKGPFSDGNLL